MFKHWMEIVHNHGNGYRDLVVLLESFPQREPISIVSFSGKGFTFEGYLEVHSLSSDQIFPFSSIKNFFKVQ